MNASDVPLGTPVRVRDVHVGVVTASLVDDSGGRAFGLEVTAPTGQRSFLPSVAGEFRGDAVETSSALFFGDGDQLEAYARGGARVVRGGEGGTPGSPAGRRARGAEAAGVLAADPGGTTLS